jgi:hypothetical protein
MQCRDEKSKRYSLTEYNIKIDFKYVACEGLTGSELVLKMGYYEHVNGFYSCIIAGYSLFS